MFRPSPFFGSTKNSNGRNRLKSTLKNTAFLLTGEGSISCMFHQSFQNFICTSVVFLYHLKFPCNTCIAHSSIIRVYGNRYSFFQKQKQWILFHTLYCFCLEIAYRTHLKRDFVLYTVFHQPGVFSSCDSVSDSGRAQFQSVPNTLGILTFPCMNGKGNT